MLGQDLSAQGAIGFADGLWCFCDFGYTFAK
jgi:hypothetical protein